MESSPRQESIENFEILKSPLREAYLLLGAHTPLELSNLYGIEDQKLMPKREGVQPATPWDYDNPQLVINKVKNILENVNLDELTEEERYWRQEILWFWYHHAISCAIWLHKDKEKARQYALKALEYQSQPHPNKITRLLYLLVNDKLEEAEEWIKTTHNENPDKETAADLLKEYKEHKFF